MSTLTALTLILSLLFWSCPSAMAEAVLIDSTLGVARAPTENHVWEHGDALYGLFVSTLTQEEIWYWYQLEVWKSTDGGAHWSELDVAGHKQMYILDGFVGAIKDGSVLSILYQSFSPTRLRVTSFNLTTEQWGGDSTTSGAPTPNPHGMYPSHGKLAVRSDDSIVVVYQGDSEYNYPDWGDIRERIYWIVYDPGMDSWGSATMIGQSTYDEDHVLAGMVLDQDDRLHIWLGAKPYPSIDPTSLRHLSIESDDSQNSIVLVGTVLRTGLITLEVSCGAPTYYQQNGSDTIAIPYSETVGGTDGIGIAIADASASPTWTLETIDMSHVPHNHPIVSASVFYNGQLHVFWHTGYSGNSDYKIWQSTRTGADSWSSPTMIFDPQTLGFYAADLHVGALSGGFAIVFSNGYQSPFNAYYLLFPKPWAYFGLPIAGGEAGSGIGIFV